MRFRRFRRKGVSYRGRRNVRFHVGVERRRVFRKYRRF